MLHGLEIALIDRIKPLVQDLVTARAAALPDLRYAGVRIEVTERKFAAAENGAAKASGDDYALAFGVRHVRDAVVGAAQLVAEDRLEILTFEQNLIVQAT